jgi:two-component sensor histidine kinase
MADQRQNKADLLVRPTLIDAYAPLLAKGLIYLTILICFIELIGWGTNSAVLSQLRTGLAAMVPSTAILLVLSSVIVLCTANNWPNLLKVICIGLIFSLALTDQVLYFSGGGGLDHMLLGLRIDFGTNRMSLMTATCFALFCGGILSEMIGIRKDRGLVVFSTLGLMIALVGIIGFIFDAEGRYAISVFSAMSVLTSITFAFLFVAVMLHFRDVGWMAILLGQGPGSRNARRIAGPLVALPIILSFFALQLSNAGMLDVNFRLSLIAIFMALSLFAGMMYFALQQNMAHAAQEKLLADLRQTVSDRNLLLSEVYHRVKNNLQQINALLSIQSRSQKSAEASDALKAMSGRIESLGVVQSLLLASPTRTSLNARDFLSELCDRLEAGLGGDVSHTHVVCKVQDMTIALDAAITLGLLVNELVSNAFKYAFDVDTLSNENRGIINVSMQQKGDTVELLIADNGRGLPDSTQTALPQGGSGATIIMALSAQLGGTLTVNSTHGLSVSILMPLKNLENNS